MRKAREDSSLDRIDIVERDISSYHSLSLFALRDSASLDRSLVLLEERPACACAVALCFWLMCTFFSATLTRHKSSRCKAIERAQQRSFSLAQRNGKCHSARRRYRLEVGEKQKKIQAENPPKHQSIIIQQCISESSDCKAPWHSSA